MYNNFSIHLEGLKEGEHKYRFLLDNTFFNSLEYSLIETGNIEVDLILVKKDPIHDLNLEFNGYVDLICDRCGETYQHKIKFTSETVLKFGTEPYEDDDLIVVSFKNNDYDISHYLYETLCLALPTKSIHPVVKGVSTCDPAALKKLNDYAVDSEENKVIDPRWEALNKLNKN